ncbi:MAG: PilT/PilU family type 4a pilus ATPase [Chloroflexi bacterium]|nr:PilT/PilU family type 4a pilus ATPase [Chloroflexota bacterium]
MDIKELLGQVVQGGASDLHIAVGAPPLIRHQGALKPLSNLSPLTSENTQGIFDAVASEADRGRLLRDREVDFAYSLPGVGRFRVNACYQRSSLKLTFRPVPFEVPELAALGLPSVCRNLSLLSRGLILICGPVGSGKSTTMSAMVDHINRTTTRHIVTIEEPIEYLHKNRKSLVTQREVGSDTTSFLSALRHVLRQDPDVIAIGELRDIETVSVAMRAAEVGHLVLGTFHARSAVEAIERIYSLYPSELRAEVRFQLSTIFEAILYQVLLPRADGLGRVAAVEVLLGNRAIKNLIRDDHLAEIPNYQFLGRASGMRSMNQALAELLSSGSITSEEALRVSPDPDGLKSIASLPDRSLRLDQRSLLLDLAKRLKKSVNLEALTESEASQLIQVWQRELTG